MLNSGGYDRDILFHLHLYLTMSSISFILKFYFSLIGELNFVSFTSITRGFFAGLVLESPAKMAVHVNLPPRAWRRGAGVEAAPPSSQILFLVSELPADSFLALVKGF